MRRQKKFKAVNLSALFEAARDIVAKKGATVLVIALFIFLAFILFRAFLYRSDYFRVRTVEVRGYIPDKKVHSSVADRMIKLYRGDNIFRANLKFMANSLQTAYPDAKDVIVKIALPDKLSVSLTMRSPVALVRGARLYPIDEDGVMLSGDARAFSEALPVIEGIRIRYDELRKKTISSQNLKAALALLRSLKKTRIMKAYGVSTIDAAEIDNLSFYLKNGTEVLIGAEDFRNRLDVLEYTLKDSRIIIERVKYIDVRFKDVVIGPR